MVDLSDRVPPRTGSSAEKPEDERKHQANDQTGDNGKIEAEFAAGVLDIAWKTAQPPAADAAPEEQAHNGQSHTQNDEKLPQLRHE